MKDVISRNSRAFGKTGVGTSELESSAFLIFLISLRLLHPHIAGESYVKFSESFLEKNSPQSEFRAKSYAHFKRTL
jgi:hypothetical protein